METILDTEQFVTYCKTSRFTRDLYSEIISTIVVFPSVYYKLESVLYRLCKENNYLMPKPPVIPTTHKFIICSYI